MPELPEVETVRRTLLPRIVGRRVESAQLLRRDVLVAPGDPAGGFARQRGGGRAQPVPLEPTDLLEGCEVVEVLRRGKQLAIVAREPGGGDRALVVQLGMSGQLFAADSAAGAGSAQTHVHAVWELAGAARRTSKARDAATCTLVFRDPRRFGGLRVIRSRAELETHWRELGPDALMVTAEELLRVCDGSVRAIKAVLMDQAAIAGVGNIYGDEALFRAAVRPSRQSRRLKPAEAEALASAIREVLQEAIDARGSTLRDYRDAEGRKGGYQARHAVYGRGGLPCTRCSRTLRSGTLAQRTTVWCNSCQR